MIQNLSLMHVECLERAEGHALNAEPWTRDQTTLLAESSCQGMETRTPGAQC